MQIIDISLTQAWRYNAQDIEDSSQREGYIKIIGTIDYNEKIDF